MEEIFESFVGLVLIVLIFGLPVIAVIMVSWTSMYKKKREKEIRQMIIENHTDAETARVLLEGKKKKNEKVGNVDLSTLRSACIMLGIGLGALINWALEPFGFGAKDINFWIIIAFGIGVGMLCSFLVELHLAKKTTLKPEEKPEED